MSQKVRMRWGKGLSRRANLIGETLAVAEVDRDAPKRLPRNDARCNLVSHRQASYRHVLRFRERFEFSRIAHRKATIRKKKTMKKIVLATVLTFAMSAAALAQGGGAGGGTGGGAGRGAGAGGAGARGGSIGASPDSTATPGTGTLNNDSPNPNGLPNNNGMGTNSNNGIGDPGNLSNTNR